MSRERIRDIRTISHVDPRKKVAIAITKEGREVKIPVTGQEDWELKIRKAKISLFPLVEKTIKTRYPRLSGPDSDFWVTTEEEAEYTQETAVCILRRNRYSVESTSQEVVNDLMELSGTKGNFSPSVVDAIVEAVGKEVRRLYRETTEARLQKR